METPCAMPPGAEKSCIDISSITTRRDTYPDPRPLIMVKAISKESGTKVVREEDEFEIGKLFS